MIIEEKRIIKLHFLYLGKKLFTKKIIKDSLKEINQLDNNSEYKVYFNDLTSVLSDKGFNEQYFVKDGTYKASLERLLVNLKGQFNAFYPDNPIY